MVFSILGTVVHLYLYATSYIVNVLDVLRLFSPSQKRRHLVSSYRQAKASKIGAGDFSETRAPRSARVSRREPANFVYSVMFLFLV